LPGDREHAAFWGGLMSMESMMNRTNLHIIDRVSWVFGLTALVGLLSTSAYLLLD
jgi:hypothetical protein